MLLGSMERKWLLLKVALWQLFEISLGKPDISSLSLKKATSSAIGLLKSAVVIASSDLRNSLSGQKGKHRVQDLLEQSSAGLAPSWFLLSPWNTSTCPQGPRSSYPAGSNLAQGITDVPYDTFVEPSTGGMFVPPVLKSSEYLYSGGCARKSLKRSYLSTSSVSERFLLRIWKREKDVFSNGWLRLF